MDTKMNIIKMNSCGHEQGHVHEFLGSTHLAEAGQDRHNHRFAGVTDEAIPIGKGNVNDGHRHEFEFATLIGPSPITD